MEKTEFSKNIQQILDSLNNKFSNAFIKLIAKMLEYHPKKRILLEDIEENTW